MLKPEGGWDDKMEAIWVRKDKSKGNTMMASQSVKVRRRVEYMQNLTGTLHCWNKELGDSGLLKGKDLVTRRVS